MNSGPELDLRNAIRFPLHLQGTLKTGTNECQVHTLNISAGGALIRTEFCIEAESTVEFSIEMPGASFGLDHPVVVACRGRVVRCSDVRVGHEVAVAIDEYRFE